MLRGASLIVLLLLLFDPALPTTARPARRLGSIAVLDASLSMRVKQGQRTRWDEGLERARDVAGAQRVVLMGGTPRIIARDSLDQAAPDAGESRLLPALQAAAEAGAEKVTVITDGGIEDLSEVERWLPRLGVQLDVQVVGAPVSGDRAIAELHAPAWAEAGKPVRVRAGVLGDASGRVLVRSGGAVLATADAPAAGTGRISMVELEFSPSAPDGGGLVRFELALDGSDAIAENNVRVFYMYVGEKPAGVALVSLAPDWEPRFLHPVLAQTLGLPVRSFLRASGSTFVSGGPGTEAGKRFTEEAVRAAVAQADVLVLHGAANDMPEWVRTALLGKPRVLVLPHENGLDIGELSLSAATPGDWFVAPEIPASPVAGMLAGMQLENLTPLMGAHLARDLPTGAWVPLTASRGRRGVQTPIAVGSENGQRRMIVSLGTGFWRWAFRGGEQKQIYTRYWGALAGWLAQERAQVAAGVVRPVTRVFERGTPIRWVTVGLAADSIRVRISGAGRIMADTAIPVEQADTASSGALPPGNYTYQAVAYAGGQTAGEASGALTVDAYSSEFARPIRSLDGLKAEGSTLALSGRTSGSRPLRTSIWPYLLLTILLATEWVLRRRWGLR